MKIKLSIIFFLALIFIPLSDLYAQKAVYSRELGNAIVPSIRALGMGGAYHGVSNDKYAAFYNPAGLARNEKTLIVDVPITLGLTQPTFSGISKVIDIIGNSDRQKILDGLQSLMGNYVGVNDTGTYISVVYKNWSVGIFANAYTGALAYNRLTPELFLKAKYDAGVVGSYSYSFLDDKSLHFGASLMFLTRLGVKEQLSATDLVKNSSKLNDVLNGLTQDLGFGVLANVGVMYELPWLRDLLHTRVGLSLSNFGWTNFFKSTRHDNIYPGLNLTFAISPHWNFISSEIVLDFVDLMFLNSDDKSLSKRINFGAEIGFFDRIFLRAGIKQGYFTCGVGFDIWAVRLNYAFYTEEMGAYGRQYADTRHVFEIVFGWTTRPDKKKEN